MSSIASFITAFCVCAIGIGALFMLCPKGNLEKSVKYIFCLVFICSLIPCLTVFKDFKISTDTSKIYYTDTAESLTKTVIVQTFESALTKAGIDFQKIEVYTDKTDSDSITISEVRVYTSEDARKIRELFGNADSFKVSIINE